jgi:hypothetical protein
MWEEDSVFDDEDKLFDREVIPENQNLKIVSALDLFTRDTRSSTGRYIPKIRVLT